MGERGAAKIVDQAKQMRATFTRTMAVVVLIGGPLFAMYCVKKGGGKTRKRWKTGPTLIRRGRS